MSEAIGTGPAEVARPAVRPGPGVGAGRRAGLRRWRGWDLVEVGLAVAAFAALCIVILRTATFMPEPDDYAYRGSIVAMTDWHFLSLSTAQFNALAAQLGRGHAGRGALMPSAIAQWVRLPDGRWISEKDPGYPFLAAPFQALGIIRWAPLFYGALGCVGLFAGARRWLGRFGGATAVGLYCSSGAAMLWGWRDYMPTFTDASLIAVGTGALLWAVLAAEAGQRRRILAGLAGFVALEAAVFTRYTDIVVLGCAVIVVSWAWRARAVRLPRTALGWWLGSVAVLGAGVAIFDDLVYGGPLRSGYRPGEVTFSLSAVLPNIRYMPAHLIQAMPVLVPALAALAWITWRWARLRRAEITARRDFAVALALAGSWLAVWGLYAAYTWTSGPGGTTLQVARFYVPALGAMSLLGAWLVTRVPRREPQPTVASLACVAVVAAMFGLGVTSFHHMLTSPLGMRIVHPCSGPAKHRPGRPSGPAHCPNLTGQPTGGPASRPANLAGLVMGDDKMAAQSPAGAGAFLEAHRG
jgi:hypothetical protein